MVKKKQPKRNTKNVKKHLCVCWLASWLAAATTCRLMVDWPGVMDQLEQTFWWGSDTPPTTTAPVSIAFRIYIK